MNARPKQKSQAELEAQCFLFNNSNPVFSHVDVKRDDGSILKTKTRSEAWVMGGHSAVVMLEGLSGAFSLDRVTKS